MAKHTVDILPPMSYSPASLPVNVGDTVEWISKDNNDVHTVTHDDRTTFRSGLLNGGDTFQHTFATAGDFPYFCEVHGKAMSAVIKVAAAATTRHTVEILSSMSYSPTPLQINVGDTVEW